MYRSCRFITVTLAILCISFVVSSANAATLVTHYDFENALNLGQDSTANLNNLTSSAGPAVTQVAGRNAGELAGSFTESALLRLSPLTSFTGASGVSYAAWVRHPAINVFDGVISQDSGGCCNFRLLLDNASATPYLNSGTHSDFSLGGPTSTTEWFHLVMSVTQGATDRTTNFYVNGAFAGTDTRGPAYPNPSGLNTYVGAGEGGAAHLFSGLLDDVQVYDGAVTAYGASQLFSTGVIPEPSSLTLLGLGMLGLVRKVRRR